MTDIFYHNKQHAPSPSLQTHPHAILTTHLQLRVLPLASLITSSLLPLSRLLLRRLNPSLAKTLPPLTLSATLLLTGRYVVYSLPASLALQEAYLWTLSREEKQRWAWEVLGDRRKRELDRCVYGYGIAAVLLLPWERSVGALRVVGGFGVGSVVGVGAWGVWRGVWPWVREGVFWRALTGESGSGEKESVEEQA